MFSSMLTHLGAEDAGAKRGSNSDENVKFHRSDSVTAIIEPAHSIVHTVW